MTLEELDEVRCRLEDFAADVFESFGRADQRRWCGVYLRGLLLDGQRKSVEPMAARLGEPAGSGPLHHHQPVGSGACAGPPRVKNGPGDQPDRADH
ncbi:transposase [Streptomyces solisilvae]|uniref:transposase n=1 Tax=Streptomyces malaysiensis TaxID=92644 RepID=UPI0036B70BD7